MSGDSRSAEGVHQVSTSGSSASCILRNPLSAETMVIPCLFATAAIQRSLPRTSPRDLNFREMPGCPERSLLQWLVSRRYTRQNAALPRTADTSFNSNSALSPTQVPECLTSPRAEERCGAGLPPVLTLLRPDCFFLSKRSSTGFVFAPLCLRAPSSRFH